MLVFYPFAFSRVCTGELCELRDNLADFSDESAEMLAISCDHFFCAARVCRARTDSRSGC